MGFNADQLGGYPNEDEIQSMIDSDGGGIVTDAINSFVSERIRIHLVELGFRIDEEDEEKIHQRLHNNDFSIQNTIEEFMEVESADVGADIDLEEESDYAVDDDSSSGEDSAEESVCDMDGEDEDDDENDLSSESSGDIGTDISLSVGARKYILFICICMLY
jgi:hypothetical protein